MVKKKKKTNRKIKLSAPQSITMSHRAGVIYRLFSEKPQSLVVTNLASGVEVYALLPQPYRFSIYLGTERTRTERETSVFCSFSASNSSELQAYSFQVQSADVHRCIRARAQSFVRSRGWHTQTNANSSKQRPPPHIEIRNYVLLSLRILGYQYGHSDTRHASRDILVVERDKF